MFHCLRQVLYTYLSDFLSIFLVSLTKSKFFMNYIVLETKIKVPYYI